MEEGKEGKGEERVRREKSLPPLSLPRGRGESLGCRKGEMCAI